MVEHGVQNYFHAPRMRFTHQRFQIFFAAEHRVDAKIIVNRDNTNFTACTEKLLTLDEYKNMFISGAAGLDLIQSKTLLLIVDVNSFHHISPVIR